MVPYCVRAMSPTMRTVADLHDMWRMTESRWISNVMKRYNAKPILVGSNLTPIRIGGRRNSDQVHVSLHCVGKPGAKNLVGLSFDDAYTNLNTILF